VDEDASGMAVMLAELLRDNLRDFPARARVAARTRGALVLTASDRDLSITVTFGRGQIDVTDGAAPGAPRLSGPWLAMSRVCSGRISPLRAMIDRELSVQRGRHLAVVPAGGFVLSVPASFYDDTGARRTRRRKMVVRGLVVVTVVMIVIAVVFSRRAATAHDH
jgi:hypothetical protein